LPKSRQYARTAGRWRRPSFWPSLPRSPETARRHPRLDARGQPVRRPETRASAVSPWSPSPMPVPCPHSSRVWAGICSQAASRAIRIWFMPASRPTGSKRGRKRVRNESGY
jgi:hypothetical protein